MVVEERVELSLNRLSTCFLCLLGYSTILFLPVIALALACASAGACVFDLPLDCAFVLGTELDDFFVGLRHADSPP